MLYRFVPHGVCSQGTHCLMMCVSCAEFSCVLLQQLLDIEVLPREMKLKLFFMQT